MYSYTLCVYIYVLHYIYYMFDCALHMYNIYIYYIIYTCTYVCVLYHMHIVTPKTNGLEELEAAGAW